MNKPLTKLNADSCIATYFGGLADGDCGLGAEDGYRRETSRKNRAAIMERFDYQDRFLLTPIPTSTHMGLKVIHDLPSSDIDRPVAEGIITSRTDMVLGIVSSDCMPVLLADRDGGLIGGIHLSRQNLVMGFPETVLETMDALGSGRIEAHIGPCLQKQSHFLKPQVAQQLIRENYRVEPHIHQSDDVDFYLLDYTAFAATELERLGTSVITQSAEDTFSNAYFSLRRRVVDGNAGANLSIISLTY